MPLERCMGKTKEYHARGAARAKVLASVPERPSLPMVDERENIRIHALRMRPAGSVKQVAIDKYALRSQ